MSATQELEIKNKERESVGKRIGREQEWGKREEKKERKMKKIDIL